jgi:hypothetical protein
MNETPDTLKVLKAYAKSVSTEFSDALPRELLSSVLVANNELLKAATIQNGGEMLISPEAIYKMFIESHHLVATVNDDGSIKLSLAPKEKILNSPDLLPL